MILQTALIMLLILSCTKNEEDIKENKLTPEQIGKIHNMAMDNFKNNFNNQNNLESKELIDEIIKFNNSFIKSELDKSNNNLNFKTNIEKHRELFNTEELAYKSFYKKSNKYSSKMTFEEAEISLNLYEKINFIYNNNLITQAEKDIMYNLIKIHQLNYEKTITDNELYSRVLKIKNDFSSLNLDVEKPGTAFVAVSIEIAVNSNEWWAENLYSSKQGKFLYKSSKVAPWVAADIIGGAASGLFNIFSQGASDGFGEISAGSVLASVAYGAVTSSVAPWSKIAKLF